MSKTAKRSRNPSPRLADGGARVGDVAASASPTLASTSRRRSFTVAPNSFDPATRTFDCVATTNTPVATCRFQGWDVVDVDEVLTISPDAISNWDLIPGTAICVDHNGYTIDGVVGVARAARIEGSSLILTCQLSARQEVADIVQDIQDGILQNFSVQFIVEEEAPWQQRDGQRPLVTVTKWRLLETSVVAIPADPNARLRSNMANKNLKIRSVRGTSKTAIRSKRDDDTANTDNDNDPDGDEDDTESRQAAIREATDNVSSLESALDDARAALRTLRDEDGADDTDDSGDSSDDDTGSRDADTEDDSDDTGGEGEDDTQRAKRSVSRIAVKRTEKELAQIRAFRSIAVRHKVVSGTEFDALVESGAGLRSLQKIALKATTDPAVAISTIQRPSGDSVVEGGARLRSFHEYRTAAVADTK